MLISKYKIFSVTQITKNTFPNKEFGILFPIDRKSKESKDVADFTLPTKELQLSSSQFPDKVKLPDGKVSSKMEIEKSKTVRPGYDGHQRTIDATVTPAMKDIRGQYTA